MSLPADDAYVDTQDLLPDEETDSIDVWDDDGEEIGPSLTWKCDFETGRIRGQIDGVDAIRQSVATCLGTQRGGFAIHSDWYGADLEGLIGLPRDEAEGELGGRIDTALQPDDRIDIVETDIVGRQPNAVTARVDVTTIDADLVSSDLEVLV